MSLHQPVLQQSDQAAPVSNLPQFFGFKDTPLPARSPSHPNSFNWASALAAGREFGVKFGASDTFPGFGAQDGAQSAKEGTSTSEGGDTTALAS